MKKVIITSLIFSLVFSCSKDDIVNIDCSQGERSISPVACAGTLCLSDTCQTYTAIWKDLLLSRNQMSQDYFNNHISLCKTILNRSDYLISFKIYYKIQIEWVEELLSDNIVIWLGPSSSGLYPSLNIPRNSLLTKENINSMLNIMAFSSEINTIASISILKYFSLEDALKTLAKSSGINKFCSCEFYFENPKLSVPPSGYPFLRAYADLT